MAPFLRSTFQNHNHSNTVTSISVDFPNVPAVQNNDVVIVFLTVSIGGFLVGYPVTPPTGYAQLAAVSGNNNAQTNSPSIVALYWHLWKTGDPVSVTFSWSNQGSPSYSLGIWGGCNPAAPIDVVASDFDNGTRTTSLLAPSLTLSSLNDAVAIFVGAQENFGATITGTPAGFTTQQQLAGEGNSPTNYFATMNTVSSPTGVQTVTFSTTSYYGGISLGLAPAPPVVAAKTTVLRTGHGSRLIPPYDPGGHQ